MSQNIIYHAEIRKWNTKKLLEVLELNGLSDCSEAIETLDIDGEAFLNLKEGQLAFWRKYLNNVQVKRLWSVIQLARERPKDFVGNIEKISNPQQEIERIRSPIAQSLENMLAPKLGITPGNSVKQDDSNVYENETISQVQGKIAYKRLPPKPVLPLSQRNILRKNSLQLPQQQQQQQIIKNPPMELYLPMKPTELEKQIFHNKPIPLKPVQQVEPILQKPEINKTKHEIQISRSNTFLHSHIRVVPPSATNEITDIETPPNNVKNTRIRRVPSPNSYSRPLPVPPKEENPFPLPPSVVPLIPNWKIGISDEDYPNYDEVDADHYKTKPWYNNIDRKQANDLLKGKPNGAFIARPSKQKNYECSLSIVYDNRVYNLAIIRQNDKLMIGNQEFDSVNEIIEFFMENEMVLNGHNNEDIFVTLRQI